MSSDDISTDEPIWATELESTLEWWTRLNDEQDEEEEE
jgi:hypothetical protein